MHIIFRHRYLSYTYILCYSQWWDIWKQRQRLLQYLLHLERLCFCKILSSHTKQLQQSCRENKKIKKKKTVGEKGKPMLSLQRAACACALPDRKIPSFRISEWNALSDSYVIERECARVWYVQVNRGLIYLNYFLSLLCQEDEVIILTN